MTELYRNEGIVILECDNHKKHAPHNWRWGFLKLRKGSCGGLDEDIVINQHKHRLRFIRKDLLGFYVFRCRTCQSEQVYVKSYVRMMLLDKIPYYPYYRWS